MKKIFFLLFIALPLIMAAQTKSGTISLNTNKNYVYECNGTFYQFYSDGTGIVNFDYYFCMDCAMEFTWKKKSSEIITITRTPLDEELVYDVKIISNTDISINEYEDKWTTYKLMSKSKLEVLED